MEARLTLETILSRRVNVFIPPFNSYDRHTLIAAELAGMNVFSASMWGPGVAGTPLHMVPATCSLTQLPKALQAARQSTWPQPVVVVLFHSYDFQEQEPQADFSLALLDQLLGETARLQDVTITTMGQLTAQSNWLTADNYANWATLRDARPHDLRRRLLPRSLWHLFPQQLLHIPSQSDIAYVWRAIHVSLTGYWLTVWLLWGVGVYAAIRLSIDRLPAVVWLVVGGGILTGLWFTWIDEQLPVFRYFFVSVSAAGCLTGCLVGMMPRQRPARKLAYQLQK